MMIFRPSLWRHQHATAKHLRHSSLEESAKALDISVGAQRSPVSREDEDTSLVLEKTRRLRIPLYARGSLGVSLALTKDLKGFERYGVIMPPEDKDAALLPRRIGGVWAMIHRPVTTLGAHMWISYSPDLRHWGSHRIIHRASAPRRSGQLPRIRQAGQSKPFSLKIVSFLVS